jgi:hypothetical protein
MVALVEAEPQPKIAGVRTEPHVIWQMAADRLADGPSLAFEIAPLTEADAPKMLALATLTKPWPVLRSHP